MTPGTKLGPYEIVSAIGAGGMGEVYRARDSKLGRDVAIKVLPDAFARDADRMARFQREAKVLASLNHPNIASIYGLEDSGSTHALVMELVEGPTLGDRIRQGPIPVDEAIRIARQIADALEYAHERGIVHRDLKPANVKVTNDDTVKVLDFGLAKALEGDAASFDISTSPTISRLATMQGVLLGTAAYMSPEQAKGKSVDRRADIWAFGCVLYEMSTGKQTFAGETVTDTLAAVIKEEPDWSRLPAATPMRVRVLLQRCLQKDTKQRLRDIGDARISLDEVLSGAAGGAPGLEVTVPAWRRALPWAVGLLLGAAVGVAAWIFKPALRVAPADTVRFQIPIPDKMTLVTNAAFALSPDGRQLAFAAAGSDGVPRLWVRALDSLEAKPLPGTESPGLITEFFWSPDSRFIAFDGGGKLKKVAISGGPPETVCDLSMGAIGGSWNRDGVIIFGQSRGELMRVSAAGGTASPLTILDRSRGEYHHAMPLFLPDGRHFLYERQGASEIGGIYVGSLDAKPGEQNPKRLLATPYGTAAYVPSSNTNLGTLFFVAEGVLQAQPFDAGRLEPYGESVALVDNVATVIDGAAFQASNTGVLVCRGGGASAVPLFWYDSEGNVVGPADDPATFDYSVALSPDGRYAAITRLEPEEALADEVWLRDFSRGTSTRFTFGSSHAMSAVWSPDASRIIFASNREGNNNLYEKAANGVPDEQLLMKSSENKWPSSWSRDGKFLLYTAHDLKTKNEIWVLPLGGDKKPFPLLRSEFNEADGRFSPDGRWVAYMSDESGRYEIYVRPFDLNSPTGTPAGGGKWLISSNGGLHPRWRGDGKELYYLTLDGRLTAVDISTSPVFRAGVPKALFQAPPLANLLASTSYGWDLAADGKRFLFPSMAAPSAQVPFTVVLNWQAELKK